ncbi:MAG: EamA family transporter [Desulfurococcales archaeon]|nr:EamA family transporter [Desulfurococcales archaeon]
MSVKGASLAVGASILWGSLGVSYKLGLESGASGEWMVLGRPLLASMAALAVILLRLGSPSRWSLAVGLLGLGPLYVFYPLSVERIGASAASVLLYTAPIWVALLGSIVVGERPRRLDALGIVLGLLGALLVSWPGRLILDALGVILGLLSGLTYAAYMVLARLASTRGASPVEVSVFAIPVAAAVTAVAVRPSGAPSPADLPWMAYLAFAATLIPYMLHVKALSLIPAHRVSIISLVEPVAAIILAYYILGERLAPLQVLGAALVIGAAAIASREGA